MKRLRENLGDRLRAQRELKGFATQMDLAVYLGVDRTMVSKWENGQIPEGENRRALCKALAITNDFFDMPEATKPSYLDAHGGAELLSRYEDLSPSLKILACAVLYKNPALLRALPIEAGPPLQELLLAFQKQLQSR